MKLIALKKISTKLQKGAEFELPDRQAMPLIAMKAARQVVEERRPRHNSERGAGGRSATRGAGYSTRVIPAAENTTVLTPATDGQ